MAITQVAEVYKSLVTHLLHNVYVVPNSFVATKNDLEKGAVFVRQNGTLIRQLSSVKGGSVGAYEGKRIGKRQQLQRLSKEITILEQELANLKEEQRAKKQAH